MDVKLPRDDALYAELAAPRYHFTSSGKLQVESKEAMKKRGVASPDRADAVCSAGQRSHDDGLWKRVERLMEPPVETWNSWGRLGV